MNAAEIVAALRRAAEVVAPLDEYAMVSVAGQPEALVREVAAAAGVAPFVNVYPLEREVIVTARIGTGITFSSARRPATEAEIAQEVTR